LFTMLRWCLALVVTMLATVAGTTPPTVVDGWGQRTAAYDGELTSGCMNFLAPSGTSWACCATSRS
jgi:hypothetical protein